MMTDNERWDGPAALRERLTELRVDALRQLAEALPIVDTELLAVAAHASIVLDVLAAAEESVKTAASPGGLRAPPEIE